MGVHVDEPGRNDEPRRIDPGGRGGAAEVAQTGDRIATNSDVGVEGGRPGSVDHRSPLDDDIEGLSLTAGRNQGADQGNRDRHFDPTEPVAAPCLDGRLRR